MFFKWVFKSAAAILIVTNTWNIVMGVFDVAHLLFLLQWVPIHLNWVAIDNAASIILPLLSQVLAKFVAHLLVSFA